LQRGLKKEAVDEFVRSAGASGSAVEAAHGVAVRGQYADLLRYDPDRPIVPDEGNRFRYFAPANDHMVWRDRPSQAARGQAAYHACTPKAE
jgi:hypothetical protein